MYSRVVGYISINTIKGEDNVKFIKLLSSIVVASLFLFTFNAATYAESDAKLVTMEKVELSQSELDKIFENMIWQESSDTQEKTARENKTISGNAYAAYSSSVFFEYSGLEPSSIMQSSSTLTVPDSDYGRTVTLTVVQWADKFSTFRNPAVLYALVNKDFEKKHYVVGRYTSENTSIDFKDIPEGEYYIWVQNANTYDISGNGYATLSIY